MTYYAKKPCKFAGNTYLIGDVIPIEVLVPSRIEALKSAGIIDEVLAEGYVNGEEAQLQTGIVKFELPIFHFGENGDVEEIPFSSDELTNVFMYLQMTASESVRIIESIEKPEEAKNVLIAVEALDNRKTVKEAARKRIEELSIKESETDAESETAKDDV